MFEQRRVPFFDYPRVYTDKRDDLLALIDEVCSRGAFILQKDLFEFESALASFAEAKFAIGVGNATDGLELICTALNLRAGDEVIFCSHTMVATASAIYNSGATPIPVEMGPDGLIDPAAVEDAINDKTVGIIPTQLNGRVCDMGRICSIAKNKGLFVAEDAAQALGARFKGQHAGTFGKAGSISFFPAKVLGSLGDGGGVVCQDEGIFDKIYQLHEHGRNREGELKGWGRNSRLDNLQAAILNFNLKSYEDDINKRRTIANCYDERLSHLDELQLPPPPNLDGANFDVFQNYEIQADKRDALRQYLADNNVGTIIQWGGKAVHQWEALGFHQKLPFTESYFERCLLLPMNTFLTEIDIDYICDVIQKFYRS